MGRRSRRQERSDETVLANPADMALLEAVEAGLVVREAASSHITAAHLLHGRPVRLHLWSLAGEELIHLPISGPPTLAPRGQRLLARQRSTDSRHTTSAARPHRHRH